MADAIRTDRQLIRMLRGLLPRFGSLTDADLDEETFEVRLREPRMAITACWYWIRKLQARFHGNDFAAAVAAAENAAPLLWTSIEFFETAEYHFYAALAHAARHDEVAPEHRARHRDALDRARPPARRVGPAVPRQLPRPGGAGRRRDRPHRGARRGRGAPLRVGADSGARERVRP